MKIIMIDPLIGNEYVALLCSGLSKAGADVTLIVPENREVAIPVNFTIRKWSPPKGDSSSKIIKSLKYIKYLYKVFALIRKIKPDAVHYHFFRRKSEILFYLLLRVLGVKLIYTAHNILPHEPSRIDYLLTKLVNRGARRIIVHSNYIKTKLSDTFKIDPNKIVVIPHGNFDFYIPNISMNKCESRKKLGLKGSSHIILFFGYIREYKGLDLLLEAFETAASEDPQLELLIAGEPSSGVLLNKYQEIIRQSEVQERIITHFNYIPAKEVAEYLVASDTVVLPYKNIDHSGIVHLAYSFDKPVIATKVGDFEESIEQGKSGFILEINNAKCLAETINEIFSCGEKLEEMGRYVKQLNNSKFSWVRIGEKTMELYARS
jgi:glycosyltransferase involved in cell wall biosynthesis